MQFFQLDIMKMKIIFDTIMLNLLLIMLDFTGIKINREIPYIDQFVVVWLFGSVEVPALALVLAVKCSGL